MTPSALQQFLASRGLKPKKSLSQNFLIDANVVEKALDIAEICAHDAVLEIGPGPGAITERLLKRGASVISVERDRDYPATHHADILEFPLETLPLHTKIVSNLPFHLTAPILAKIVPFGFQSVTVFVQEEVARRMVAQPNTKEYGSFSLLLQFYAEVRYGFKVSKHCFYPRPNVEAAVVQILPKKRPDVEEESFFAMVHKAFQGRRKMLRRTLGFGGERRPENLSLQEFIALHKEVS
ncbi:MAG: 16S rRNA (adenine(1518)-N(6)/adenine(1519)-N(6))-dimethyltransferase RsmA [Chlamydiales bacterium]